MHCILALAGLAEMSIAESLRQIYIGVAVAVVLCGIAWWRRSRILGLIALTACIVVGVYCNPIQSCFWTPNGIDPDETYWSARCFWAGSLWILCSVVCFVSLMFFIWRRRACMAKP